MLGHNPQEGATSDNALSADYTNWWELPKYSTCCIFVWISSHKMSQLLLLGSRVAVGCCRLTRRNLLPIWDSKRFELVVATSTKCNANFEGKQRGFHGHGAAGEDRSDPGKWGTSSGLLMAGAAAVIGGTFTIATINSSS